MPVPAVIGGKKGNTTVTSSQETNFNQALQDSAIGVSTGGDGDVNILTSDQGAIDAGREIARAGLDFGRDALDFGRDALSTTEARDEMAFGAVRDAISSASSQTRDVVASATDAIRVVVDKALNTANIRSQVPAETLASDGGATLRTALLVGAALIAAALYFRSAR